MLCQAVHPPQPPFEVDVWLCIQHLTSFFAPIVIGIYAGALVLKHKKKPLQDIR